MVEDRVFADDLRGNPGHEERQNRHGDAQSQPDIGHPASQANQHKPRLSPGSRSGRAAVVARGRKRHRRRTLTSLLLSGEAVAQTPRPEIDSEVDAL